MPAENLHKELNKAYEAIQKGNREEAWSQLKQVLLRVSEYPLKPENDQVLVETSIKFSDLCWMLGRGFNEAITFLEVAVLAVERLGDRRSRALIRLHLGRLYFLAARRNESMVISSLGKEEVEDLGDEDIMTQAAELIGTFYFIQGLFTDALPHIERAAQAYESGDTGDPRGSASPILLGFCKAYLGQFYDAIGTVDYYRRLALNRSDHALATSLRSTLGIILAIIHKRKEGSFHLTGALEEAQNTGNVFAALLAKAGLAYTYYLEARWEDVFKLLAEVVLEGATSGLVMQYASSYFYEVLFELHRRNISLIPGLDFNQEINRLLNEPNINLRGVALRLKAIEALDGDEYKEIIESDLEQSLEYLKQSGDPIQLAKTQLEIAHLNLLDGDSNKARLLVDEAWRNFSGLGDIFFPDDLRHLLAIEGAYPKESDNQEKFVDMFLDIIQELAPSPDLDEILFRTVTATNRIFGAQRGGIFWYGNRTNVKTPQLRVTCNLGQADVTAEEFRPSQAMISKSYRQNKPVIEHYNERELNPDGIKAVLCVPFEVDGRVQGVLYHDNSLVESCFDYFDDPLLIRLSKALAGHIGSLIEYSRNVERKATRKISQLGTTAAPEIITNHRDIVKILDHIDQIAPTDCNVLILGETGVGKELVARRLHNMSHRAEEPFVIVDPTTIPDNLVESELFGHEKGAFTGADRQKTGRIELAHRGTLFIDEIAEIQQSIQVKFLRVLQEKNFRRVGGNLTIKSDFRIVAATNRNLDDEVRAGRFRKDLFYRLNVVELNIPPLRERKEDIPLLARHFLNRFSVKYNRPDIRLTPEDESILMKYDWLGNIRELENVIERSILLSSGGKLELSLPTGDGQPGVNPFSDYPPLDEIQRRYIQQVLKKTSGKIGGPDGAAAMLGMKRTSLISRLKKLGLR